MVEALTVSLTTVVAIVGGILAFSAAAVGFFLRRSIEDIGDKIEGVDDKIEKSLQELKTTVDEISEELKNEQAKNQKEIRDIYERLHKLEIELTKKSSSPI